MPDKLTIQSDKNVGRDTSNLADADRRDLKKKLEKVHDFDQKYRSQFAVVEKSHGRHSGKFQTLVELCKAADATNLKIVTSILDEYGWLGADQIGDTANRTLFLVIQHADHDRETQAKYLPMLREAVSNKKASPVYLAMLEDRLAIANSLPQVYGSQLELNKAIGKYQLSPVKNVATLNERRANIGLVPMSEYLRHWNLNWSEEKLRLEKLESN